MAARLPDPTSPHAVADGISRVLFWLRLVVMANAIAFGIVQRDAFDRPVAAAFVLAGIVLWTAFCSWAYDDHRRRTPLLLVVDLAVTVAALVSTPWLKGDDFSATVPGFWVMTVVLVWAAYWGARGGFAAAVAIAAADLGIRWPDISESNYGNVFLLLIGGPLLGRLASALKDLARERDAAQRAAALAEERTRLARVVHDGVLQVLALVQRRAPELGASGVELGALAGEQEARLRALIQTSSGGATNERADTGLDVAALVSELALRRTPAVRVATPAEPVLLPGAVAAELVAAAEAALDNVSVHVDPAAPAWVLVEDLGGSVVLTVRDEGPGIPEGRLASARSAGRLGVAESIQGRLHDLGGSARLTTGPGGTEWELEVRR